MMLTGAVLLTVLMLGVSVAGTSAEKGPEVFAGSPRLVGRKVLLVHSYHREHPWVGNVEAGVRSILEPPGVRLEAVYMDTKRFPDRESKEQAGLAAGRLVESMAPDVIIASEDKAQEYFAKQYAGVPGAPKVVFCAVNEDPAVYGYPADNVAGVVEQLFFERSLTLLHRIVPEVRSLLVISDESPSSRAAVREMRSREVDLDRVEWRTCTSFEEWKRELLVGQQGVDAVALVTYHTLKDHKGRSVDPATVLSWTSENLSRPSLGFHIFTIADGALCGIAQSGFEHGVRSGSYALQLLQGKNAVEIGKDSSLKGVVMINIKAAERLGISVPKSVQLLADGVIE